MSFVHKVRVRYSEVDMQGVVFNAHWLTYFDDAVTQFFSHLGYPPESTFSQEFDFMVVKAAVEWSGPAGFEDDIAIELHPVRLGTSSFENDYSATVDGMVVCEARITYVLIEAGTNRALPLPDELRNRLQEEME
jgi:acyl-CoA thioester hydrolase